MLRLKIFDKSTANTLSEYLLEEAQHIDQITLLLNKTQYFLREKNILSPSEDTLRRLIIKSREKARHYIFSRLENSLTDIIRKNLDELLIVDETRLSKLHQLKKPPGVSSPQAFLNLVKKLEIIEDTKVLTLDLTWLNNNYKRNLSKYVYRCSAKRLQELQTGHRLTALVCFFCQTSLDTVDYMVDMHAKLMTKLYT